MTEIAAEQAPDRKRFIATLIGFSAVLMWALLALFTAASGAVPPFQLSAMCFAIGAAIVNGVHYYSWSGVGSITNPLDLLDVFWTLTSLISEEPNDGLVGRCSSHLGTVIRDDYFHNHIDETNMLVGLVFAFGAKPPSLFRAHANRLKNRGLYPSRFRVSTVAGRPADACPATTVAKAG